MENVTLNQRIYNEAVREALTVVWEAADRICVRGLEAALPSMVAMLLVHVPVLSQFPAALLD